MIRRFVISSILLLTITTPCLLADTIRCVFPQIAVGNTIVTVIDLTNQGTTTVQGYLELLDSNSNQLSLQVNGVAVTGYYDFEIPPRATRRFRLTRQGTEIPGHAIVWETSSAEDVFKVPYTNQIHGTAVFQVLSGGQLVDSIGVPGGSNAFLGEGYVSIFSSSENTQTPSILDLLSPILSSISLRSQ